MFSALLFTENRDILSVFQSVALNYGCIVKHMTFGENVYNYACDTPFSAVFADVSGMSRAEADNKLTNIAAGVKSLCFYKLISNGEPHTESPEYISLEISNRERLAEIFSKILSDKNKESRNILSALRICNDRLLTQDIFTGRILLAVYPLTSANVTAEILSAFPIESLPENTDCFTDGIAVYAFAECGLRHIYKISLDILNRLKKNNLRVSIFFSDRIASFEEASTVFSDLNAYAVRCRLNNSNMEISYYNSTMQMLEPFGYMIRRAQITGNEIRNIDNEKEINCIINDFFEQIQISSSLRTNMQFLVCEMLRSAFDDTTLQDNLINIVNCTNRQEINKLVVSLFNKEKSKHDSYSITDKDRIVLKVLEIIDREYATDLSLGKIAERVYLSPAYISRIFKKSQKVSFIKYLNNVRLEKAAQLLKVNNYTTKEISRTVGFRDVSYFCLCFKNKYGMSTAQYRRMNLLDN